MDFDMEGIKQKILFTLVCKEFPTADKYGIKVSVFFDILTSMEHDGLISGLLTVGTQTSIQNVDIASIRITDYGKEYYRSHR